MYYKINSCTDYRPGPEPGHGIIVNYYVNLFNNILMII